MAYRKFKPEFKRRVAEEWLSGGKRIAEVCRKCKLSDSVVRRSRKEYERKDPGACGLITTHHSLAARMLRARPWRTSSLGEDE
jgi:transposase-like protein